MKKPKILHLILDGYSPMNPDNFFGNFLEVVPHSYKVSSFVRDVDIAEGKLRSPDQWTKCYSKTSFPEIHQEGDSGRLGVSSKIGRVPTENFLWNVLAKSGVNSWIYPFGHYYHLIDRNMLDDTVSDKISGFIKMYGTKLGCQLDNGVRNWHKSPISVYYGLHEASWGRELKGDFREVFENYRRDWKEPSDEFLAKVPEDCHRYYVDRFTSYLGTNMRLFKEEIFPHLQKHIDSGEFSDGGYVHIGLVEPDTPYHFAPVYPDLVSMVNEYCSDIVSHAIDIFDPDIVIITGDHGMEPVDDTWKGAKPLTYKGNTRLGAVSDWGVAPIYNEHSHDVGCMFYAKDKAYIDKFESEYLELDKYLMYDLYNFIRDAYLEEDNGSL